VTLHLPCSGQMQTPSNLPAIYSSSVAGTCLLAIQGLAEQSTDISETSSNMSADIRER
jgi:hypothetical protein